MTRFRYPDPLEPPPVTPREAEAQPLEPLTEPTGRETDDPEREVDSRQSSR